MTLPSHYFSSSTATGMEQPSSFSKLVVKRDILFLLYDSKGGGTVFLLHLRLKGWDSGGTDPLKRETSDGELPSPFPWVVLLKDSGGAGALLLLKAEAEGYGGVLPSPPPPPY